MNNLINHFKHARDNFIDVVNQIPINKQDVVIAGDWTAKDILSHLIGWADFQNNILKNLLDGKQPENFFNVSEYNEKSVNKRRFQSWKKTVSQLIKSTNYLISQYQILPDALWDKLIWQDKKTTPAKLIKIETRHYLGEHLEQIKKCAQ